MGVMGDTMPKTLYLPQKRPLTPHKLCEFLDFFKNIFQGSYLVKKEPISF